MQHYKNFSTTKKSSQTSEQQFGETPVELLLGVVAVEGAADLRFGDELHVVQVPVEGLHLVDGVAARPADPLRPRLRRGDLPAKALPPAGQDFHDVVVVVPPVLVDVLVGQEFRSGIMKIKLSRILFTNVTFFSM